MVSSDEADRLRKEVHLLENLVQELRAELKNKRPQTANANQEWEDEKIDLEVRLQKNQVRVDALQNELNNTASHAAREISKLKLIIAVRNHNFDLNYRRKSPSSILCLQISMANNDHYTCFNT